MSGSGVGIEGFSSEKVAAIYVTARAFARCDGAV